MFSGVNSTSAVQGGLQVWTNSGDALQYDYNTKGRLITHMPPVTATQTDLL